MTNPPPHQADELTKCRLKLRRLSTCLAVSLTFHARPELTEPRLLEQFQSALEESLDYLESVVPSPSPDVPESV